MTLRPWTTPDDLRRILRKQWDRGAVLRAEVDGQSMFPFRFRLARPTTVELSSRFEDVRKWMEALKAMPDLRVEWKVQGTRTIGRNEVPDTVWVDDIDAAARLLDTSAELVSFRATVATARARMPMLVDWLATYPMDAISLALEWARVLDVVEWMCANPNPGVYVETLSRVSVSTQRDGTVLRQRMVLSTLRSVEDRKSVV